MLDILIKQKALYALLGKLKQMILFVLVHNKSIDQLIFPSFYELDGQRQNKGTIYIYIYDAIFFFNLKK